MAQVSTSKFFASLDIDFFACQVWCKKQKDLRGHPLIVYDENSKYIISVNNLAVDRAGKRLSRNQKVNEARNLAANPSELECFPVPVRFGKSSQRELREASHRIEDCVRSYINRDEPLITVKKTMKDEIGLDITEAVLSKIGLQFDVEIQPQVSWIPNEEAATEGDKIAAEIVSSLLGELEISTGFHASAGVGPSLIVAKIARERNKPRGLTVVPSTQVDFLYQQVRLQDAPQFRGIRGTIIKNQILRNQNASLFNFKTLAARFANGKEMFKELFVAFDRNKFNESVCHTLWLIAMGLDEELSEDNQQEVSFSYSYFVHIQDDNNLGSLTQAFKYAAEELKEILQEERQRKNRTPTLIKFKFQWKSGSRPAVSFPINFSIDPKNKEDFGLSLQKIITAFNKKLATNVRKKNSKEIIAFVSEKRLRLLQNSST